MIINMNVITPNFSPIGVSSSSIFLKSLNSNHNINKATGSNIIATIHIFWLFGVVKSKKGVKKRVEKCS